MDKMESFTLKRDESSYPSGTPGYIAPERYNAIPYAEGDLSEKTKVAKKSDVYSYGVVLWEIIERRPLLESMS